MKLINSRKEFEDLIDSGEIDGFIFDDVEDYHSPCWEVKIDKRDKKAMIFLVDGEEKLLCPLSKLDDSFLTLDKISELISILKVGDFKELKKVLGIKRGR